jgi:hypothetical protein
MNLLSYLYYNPGRDDIDLDQVHSFRGRRPSSSLPLNVLRSTASQQALQSAARSLLLGRPGARLGRQRACIQTEQAQESMPKPHKQSHP